jgi:hypothetical protein
VKWTERGALDDIDCPGVYLIAHFDRVPNQINLQSRRIVYIGETTGEAGLLSRLNRFNSASITGRARHSGGRSYHEFFGNEHRDEIYVSIYPVQNIQRSDVRTSYIKYIERKLIWEYCKRWHRNPECNTI